MSRADRRELTPQEKVLNAERANQHNRDEHPDDLRYAATEVVCAARTMERRYGNVIVEVHQSRQAEDHDPITLTIILSRDPASPR